MTKMVLAPAVVAVVLLLGSNAFAQNGKVAPKAAPVDPATDGHYEYSFPDDALDAAPNGPYLDWFRHRIRQPRATLIRPRVQFIPELIKSCEGI